MKTGFRLKWIHLGNRDVLGPFGSKLNFFRSTFSAVSSLSSLKSWKFLIKRRSKLFKNCIKSYVTNAKPDQNTLALEKSAK